MYYISIYTYVTKEDTNDELFVRRIPEPVQRTLSPPFVRVILKYTINVFSFILSIHVDPGIKFRRTVVNVTVIQGFPS